MLAPLFCLQDAVALRYWRPRTWSKPDVVILIPAILAGMLVGYLLLRDEYPPFRMDLGSEQVGHGAP